MFQGLIRTFESRDTAQVDTIFDLYWSGDFRKNLSQRLTSPDLHWFVAEENEEIVGVAAFRKAPTRMCTYATTDRVAEFYVVAVKYKGRGIGAALRAFRIQKAREAGFKEIVFFSGESHKDSWAFHDNSEFKRVGDAIAPDGEAGKIWLMDLRM